MYHIYEKTEKNIKKRTSSMSSTLTATGDTNSKLNRKKRSPISFVTDLQTIFAAIRRKALPTAIGLMPPPFFLIAVSGQR